MSDIFISYASEDKGRVQALACALEQRGWSVWWDRRIPIGRSFDEVIEEALDGSKAVVVVWTQASVKSQWVKNEAREGLRRRVLFPVMLLEEVKLPLEFRDVQTAQLTDWQPEQEHAGFEQFLDDLIGVIGSPAVKRQAPPASPTKQTPEPEVELLSPSAAEVEHETERLEPEPEPSGETGDVAPPDVPSASFRSPSATEVSGGDWKSSQVNADRSNESTETGQPSDSFPYLPIGLGLLVVVGALVYFLIFSQGPSPGTRDVAQYQPPIQPPPTRGEVITSPPAPEPKPPAETATQERPAVKQGTGLAKKITGKDGAPMVLVPAGSFQMGAGEDDKFAVHRERPSHSVYLDAFSIDQYEVTTTRYAIFLHETKRHPPKYWSEQVPRAHGIKPVIGVDWNDAQAYCEWTGKRLPTEAEWEKAARGTDGRKFPWGNVEPSQAFVNINGSCEPGDNSYRYGELADVGSFERGKSPYGVYDMAGNVWEWVADWYGEYYYQNSPERNPRGPSSGKYRVIRGGSCYRIPDNVRSANRYRYAPSTRLDELGFRCAQDISN